MAESWLYNKGADPTRPVGQGWVINYNICSLGVPGWRAAPEGELRLGQARRLQGEGGVQGPALQLHQDIDRPATPTMEWIVPRGADNEEESRISRDFRSIDNLVSTNVAFLYM